MGGPASVEEEDYVLPETVGYWTGWRNGLGYHLSVYKRTHIFLRIFWASKCFFLHLSKPRGHERGKPE